MSAERDASRILAELLENKGRISEDNREAWLLTQDAETFAVLEEICKGLNLDIVPSAKSINVAPTPENAWCRRALSAYTKDLYTGCDTQYEQRLVMIYLTWYIVYTLMRVDEITKFVEMRMLIDSFDSAIAGLAKRDDAGESVQMVAKWWGQAITGQDETATGRRLGIGSANTKMGCAKRVYNFLIKVGVIEDTRETTSYFVPTVRMTECYRYLLSEADAPEYEQFIYLVESEA